MRYGKTRVYKDNKWTEVDVKTDIKCNLCGHSCYLGLNRFLRDNHIETGGLSNAHVSGGYESTPGNGCGAFGDGDVYNFSFCEFCLDFLFENSKIPIKEWDVHTPEDPHLFVSALEKVKFETWRQEKTEFLAEYEKRKASRKLQAPDNPKEIRRYLGTTLLLHNTEGPALKWEDGSQFWFFFGKLHSYNDQPAVIFSDGRKEWWREGVRDRKHGPAVILPDGTEEYYSDGSRHRQGGPAVISPDGTQLFYEYGKLHNENGPACIWESGSYSYDYREKEHRDGGPSYVSEDRVTYSRHGRLHNLEGPAWIDWNGKIAEEKYYIDDLELSKEDWEVQRHQFHPVRTDDILLSFRYYKDPEHTILHRINGPAIESFWEGEEYWIDGIKQPDPEKS